MLETPKAIVVLAEGFEEIEAVAPIDVLRRAGVDVVIAGLDGKIIKGAHGISIAADIEFSDARDADALILPGGLPGAENLAASEAVRNAICAMSKGGGVVAAICASPAYVLAPTGILNGKRAACYPGCEERFDADVTFVDDRVVRDGNVITSRGPGTAIEFSLKIVEALTGKEKADELRAKMLSA